MVSGPNKPRSTPDCNNQSYTGKYLLSAKCLTFISTLNSSKEHELVILQRTKTRLREVM